MITVVIAIAAAMAVFLDSGPKFTSFLNNGILLIKYLYCMQGFIIYVSFLHFPNESFMVCYISKRYNEILKTLCIICNVVYSNLISKNSRFMIITSKVLSLEFLKIKGKANEGMQFSKRSYTICSALFFYYLTICFFSSCSQFRS